MKYIFLSLGTLVRQTKIPHLCGTVFVCFNADVNIFMIQSLAGIRELGGDRVVETQAESY